MKAVRLHEYGGIDVLQVEEVPAPVPGDGEVLVRVKAAGINPGEAAIRSGALKEQMPSTFPSGEGSDLAGVVEASNAPPASRSATRCWAIPGRVAATPSSRPSRRRSSSTSRPGCPGRWPVRSTSSAAPRSPRPGP